MLRTRYSLLALLALAATVPARALAQGCAMCGNSIGAGDPFANALNSSILFLMAAPYTLAGAVGTWLYWSHRRAHPRRRARLIEFPWPGGPTDAAKEDPS